MQSNSEKYYEISMQAKEGAGFPNNYTSLSTDQRYFVDSLLEKSFEKDENYGIIIDEVKLAIDDLHDTRASLVKLLSEVSGDINE
tara:strand:- start:79 stop:333 length:255 start_codon:yes stop_codon:yes gene_type:complete